MTFLNVMSYFVPTEPTVHAAKTRGLSLRDPGSVSLPLSPKDAETFLESVNNNLLLSFPSTVSWMDCDIWVPTETPPCVPTSFTCSLMCY